MGEDQRAKRGAKDTEADQQRFPQCRQLLITTLGLKILFQISGSATMPRQLPSAAHITIGEGGSTHTLKNMCYHHKGIVSFKRLTSLCHPSGSNRLFAGSYHRALSSSLVTSILHSSSLALFFFHSYFISPPLSLSQQGPNLNHRYPRSHRFS